jgi:hypothetical protein
MDGKRILEIVRDVAAWKGDVFNLAMTVAATQREHDAELADAMDAPAVAEALRAGE